MMQWYLTELKLLKKNAETIYKQISIAGMDVKGNSPVRWKLAERGIILKKLHKKMLAAGAISFFGRDGVS